MSLQDLPEVPTLVPSVEENEEKLDLPDVPTKAPVATEVVADKAQEASVGVSSARKGYSLQENLLLYIYFFPVLNNTLYVLHARFTFLRDFLFVFPPYTNAYNSYGGTIASLMRKACNARYIYD